MTTAQPGYGIPKSITQQIRDKWGGFLALGVVLVIGGTLSILLPVVSTLATSLFLGAVLLVTGVACIFHAFQVKTWSGFLWDLVVGLIQVLGGFLIFFNPLAGAITLTILIAAIFGAQGIAQIMLAFRVRPHDGWGWLLASGIVALAVAVLLMMRFPATAVTAPGMLAGISLVFSGWSYIMIALAARRLTA